MTKDRSLKIEIDAAERAAIFHDQYGNDLDAADTLPEFIIAAGDYIARIVGPEEADAGHGRHRQGSCRRQRTISSDPSKWREALLAARSDCYSEWLIGPALHDLAAYAEYGIVLHDSEDADVLAQHVQELLKQAQDLLARTPNAQWNLEANNSLARLVMIASNRWARITTSPSNPQRWLILAAYQKAASAT